MMSIPQTLKEEGPAASWVSSVCSGSGSSDARAAEEREIASASLLAVGRSIVIVTTGCRRPRGLLLRRI